MDFIAGFTWGFIGGCFLGAAIGFALAAIVTVGKRADENEKSHRPG